VISIVRSLRASIPLAGAVLLLALVCAARAAPVAIDNAGFEDLYLGSNLPPEYGGDVPAGAFPTGPPPAGWTAWYEGGSATGAEFLGVLNPGTSADYGAGMPCFPAGAPEGDNVALLYGAGDAGGDAWGITQELGATLAANTRYTLRVEVGNIQSCAGLVAPYLSFFDLDGFPGYRIQLLAGGVVIAEDTGSVAPGEGVFETATLVHTTGSDPEQEGEPLEIRLVNEFAPDVGGVDGLEVDFDDVRLDASPAAAVPLGPALGGLAAALLAFVGIRRLRSRR
jgi:hypothetical protein